MRATATRITLGILLLLAMHSFGIDVREGASQEQYTLTAVDHFPPGHLISENVCKPWMKAVEERTKGRVKFKYFPAEQLVKAKEMVRALENKAVDIALVFPAYFSDQIPLSAVLDLPDGYKDAVEGGRILYKLAVAEDGFVLREELLKRGIRGVVAGAYSPYEINTVNKKIESLTDIKGLKIRSSGVAGNMILTAFGASPVMIPPPEIFTAMQRGTVDGSMGPFMGKDPYGMYKLAKFSTLGASFSGTVFLYCIREDVWQKMPQDLRQIMTVAGLEVTESWGKYSVQDEKDGQALAKSLGIEFSDFAAIKKRDQKTWNEVVRSIREEWAKRIDAKGGRGTEALKAYLKAAEEVRKAGN